MSQPEIERMLRRHDDDITAIYGMLTDIQSVQQAHTTRFDGIDARLDRHDTRFDGIDTRFDEIDARLSEILALLGGPRR